MWTVLSRKKVKFEFLRTDVILGFNSLWPNDHLTNPAMPKTHIPHCPILMQKCAQTCMSAKNGALWAMGLVHCGIGEIGHWPLISDCLAWLLGVYGRTWSRLQERSWGLIPEYGSCWGFAALWALHWEIQPPRSLVMVTLVHILVCVKRCPMDLTT